MKGRNTIQKQTILNSIRNTKRHPSANDLYDIISKIDSTIGKSTVYRNLNQMVENGDIKIIATRNGLKRYDGNVLDHDHFICYNCSRVFDLDVNNSDNSLIENEYNFKVINKNTVYEGFCEDCLKK